MMLSYCLCDRSLNLQTSENLFQIIVFGFFLKLSFAPPQVMYVHNPSLIVNMGGRRPALSSTLLSLGVTCLFTFPPLCYHLVLCLYIVLPCVLLFQAFVPFVPALWDLFGCFALFLFFFHTRMP